MAIPPLDDGFKADKMVMKTKHSQNKCYCNWSTFVFRLEQNWYYSLLLEIGCHRCLLIIICMLYFFRMHSVILTKKGKVWIPREPRGYKTCPSMTWRNSNVTVLLTYWLIKAIVSRVQLTIGIVITEQYKVTIISMRSQFDHHTTLVWTQERNTAFG